MTQSTKYARTAAVAVIALLAVLLAPSSSRADGASTPLIITSSLGVPDRGDTVRAIDNDLTTDTYTTPANTQDFPAYLEFGFASTAMNRIRYLKDDYVGPFNLAIQYTTDTDADLSARTYTNVSGLTNGFHGTELLNATSVNSDGTVTGDAQDDPTAWASLSFNRVTATGVRIAFSGSNPCCNHYHVYEFAAYNDIEPSSITVTSPNGGESWGAGSVQNITWSFNGEASTATVKIELLKGATKASTIKPKRAIGKHGVGSYAWTVPDLPGTRYRIRITVNGTADTDTSNAAFSIT
ncbi:MAG TPA: Ser-Thr-rich GPI-anchored membrane family protein [Acidimicrobiales bacterium]|nr:Ser-Thr-rich GPI-anchored membrane family protein [Acidimicrobiales bacterium]